MNWLAKNWKYCVYLARHKAFVFVAGLKTKAPLFRLLIHDWTKFVPCEWFPYLEYFYGRRAWLKDNEPDDFRYWTAAQPYIEAFQKAWLHHIHWNKHHWQYWVLIDDPATNVENNVQALRMPEKYVREMVADWAGAGRAIKGKWDVQMWYEERKDRITLHQETRKQVEELIRKVTM